MLQQGMTFGSEGPLIQGTWVNPKTGDSFTVRDSFFEDNQYIVSTTDGRYIRYDQLQHYIQADPKSIDSIKQAAANKVNDEPIPAEIASLIDNDTDTMITPEDYDIIYGKKSLGNLNNTARHIAPAHAHAAPSVTTGLHDNMNTAIIEKALKNTDKPKFKVNVDWVNFPTKQIEMLYDIMGISEEEIIEWYLDNIQLTDVIDTLKDSIKARICSTKQLETVVCDMPVITEVKILEPETVEKPKEVKPKKITKSKK